MRTHAVITHWGLMAGLSRVGFTTELYSITCSSALFRGRHSLLLPEPRLYFNEEYPEQFPLSQAELLMCFVRRRASKAAGRGLADLLSHSHRMVPHIRHPWGR